MIMTQENHLPLLLMSVRIFNGISEGTFTTYKAVSET